MEQKKLNQLKSVFTPTAKLTLVEISSSMAMCYRREIVVKEIQDENNIIFSYKGKRKKFIFPFQRKAYTYAPITMYHGAVFKGHCLPFLVDTDENAPCVNGMRQMRGNALYNFLGNTEEVRTYIDTHQLNPFFEKDHVIAIDESGKETLVYPELYQGGHAVIDRILKNQTEKV